MARSRLNVFPVLESSGKYLQECPNGVTDAKLQCSKSILPTSVHQSPSWQKRNSETRLHSSSSTQNRLTVCHNIMSLVVQTRQVLFSFFHLVVFLWTTLEFSHNSHGRAEAFFPEACCCICCSNTHCIILFLHNCVPEMKARQHKPLNNEPRDRLEPCGSLLILERWFSRFQYNEKLFLTVLKCHPHMRLLTKRTFGWEIAEADCLTFGHWKC